MKKHIVITCICILLSTVSMAQLLTAKFEGPVSEFSKVYLLRYDMVNHQFLTSDSALIKDGGFQFHLKEDKEPSFAYLRLKDQKGNWIWTSTVELFVAPDSILLLCEDSLKNARIFNSPINYDHLRLNEMTAPGRKYADDIHLRYIAETKKVPPDILNTKEYQQFGIKRFQAARQGLYDAYETFIDKNPSSWISLYALRRRMQEMGADFVKMNNLFLQLDQNIRESTGGTSIAKRLSNMRNVQVGSTAPVFQLPNIKGQLVDLKNYRGKYVLLEFWSSGCGPCRLEAPHLKSAFAKYRDNGFDILSISLDDANQYKGKENWLKAVEKDETGIWQQVSDLKGSKSPVVAAYNVGAIPQNFLLDPDGLIIAKNLRGGDLHDYLEKLFGKE
ncbi:TlpA disulfide reductase family protein [Chitinophaga defluvii]|uniref:TlpA disulfide reductase family protein n=1 Tax=Chitinophaga defluvii TaxID=3163343 RepID=A0ABV2SZW7_9BACT